MPTRTAQSPNGSLKQELFFVYFRNKGWKKHQCNLDMNYELNSLSHTFHPFPSSHGNDLQCHCFLKQRPDFINQEVNVKHISGRVRCHQLRPKKKKKPSLQYCCRILPGEDVLFLLTWAVQLLEHSSLTCTTVTSPLLLPGLKWEQ